MSDEDLKLMRRVDEFHRELPFPEPACCVICCGEKVMRRRHMNTFKRRMSFTALYRNRSTSKKTPGRTIYPYLLHTLAVIRAN